MQRRRTISGISILVLATVMAILHISAYRYSLYFTVEWFDLMMHLLGGLLIGASVGWLIRFEVPIGLRSKISTFWTIMIGVFIVAVLWEAFEFVTGLAPSIGYQQDTVEDLIMGLVGAAIAYGVFKK